VCVGKGGKGVHTGHGLSCIRTAEVQDGADVCYPVCLCVCGGGGCARLTSAVVFPRCAGDIADGVYMAPVIMNNLGGIVIHGPVPGLAYSLRTVLTDDQIQQLLHGAGVAGRLTAEEGTTMAMGPDNGIRSSGTYLKCSPSLSPTWLVRGHACPLSVSISDCVCVCVCACGCLSFSPAFTPLFDISPV
jgi:hypothetical protein